MRLIELDVRELHQWSHAYAVIFRASLLISEDDPVLLTELVFRAEKNYRGYEEQAYQSIINGFHAVLTPRNWWAVITVSDIHIHPVDFIEQMFEKFAARYLEEALAGVNESNANRE